MLHVVGDARPDGRDLVPEASRRPNRRAQELNAGRTQLFTVRMFRVMITSTPSEAAAFAALLIVIILIALGVLSKVTGKSFVDLFRV